MSNYKIEDIYRISSTRPNSLEVCNLKSGRHLSEIVVGDNNGSIFFFRPNRANNSIEVIFLFYFTLFYFTLLMI